MSNDRASSFALPPPVQAFPDPLSSSPRVSSISSSAGYHEGSQSSFSTAPSSHGPKTPSPTFPANVVTAPSTAISSYDAMNHSATDMYYSQPMSAGQPAPPQTVTSSGLSHYPQQPPILQPGPYHNQGSYPSYGYSNGLTSPPGAPPSVSNMGASQNVLPLPGVGGGQNNMPPQYAATYDTTGQQPPHGMKPRVTATLWEDEGSLCFQVEARGICVARREDNHMINGTKLLNVAGMTRGRRDGILKSEKIRHVVKIGPMHLKGVWIPYDRALEFANKEKITEMLYPLFVHNIGALLYHPSNQNRTTQVMAAAERRKQDQGQMRTPAPGLPSIQQHGHPGSQPPLPSHGNMGRPPLDRAHTFPTPPSSTSNVMGNMGNSENFGWQGHGMGGAQGNHSSMPIDAGLNSRSMPTTPATTPPGPGVQNMSSYPPVSQGYDSSRQLYNAPSSHQSPYQPAGQGAQDRLYGQPGGYPKQDMGPPSTRPAAASGPGDQHHHESKPPNGIIPGEPGSQHHPVEEEGDHDAEYTHDSAGYDTQRNSYNYTAPGVGALANESNLSPELAGSPSHPPGSGRATPRTAAPPQPYYNQHTGYNTPPRVQQSTSNLYNVMTNDRAPTNGAPSNDVYGHNPEMSGPMSNGYASQPPPPPPMNGSGLGSTKRSREDEDEEVSRGGNDGMEMKRRKTLESSVPAPPYDAMNRPTSAVSAPRRR